ncbi:MAG: CBU_0592 family membrane protein [Thermomicrobiales bacterium]
MEQVLQVIGALMLLAGFALAQFHVLDQRSTTYLVLNFVGSTLLAVLAYIERQWGFFLLEGVWSIVSIWGLIAHARGRDVMVTH